MKMRNIITSSFLSFILIGCTNVPSEAPELSSELGKRIQLIEQSHKSLVHQFFDEKRKQVDAFLYEVWLPLFTENFLSNKKVENVWEQVVRSNNKENRLQFILRTAPKIQKALSDKRAELHEPLNTLERDLLASLSSEYDNMKSINNTLTSYLTSASDIAESRQRYMDMVGVSENKYSNMLDSISDTVSGLTKHVNKMEEYESHSEKYIQTFNELKNKM